MNRQTVTALLGVVLLTVGMLMVSQNIVILSLQIPLSLDAGQILGLFLSVEAAVLLACLSDDGTDSQERHSLA